MPRLSRREFTAAGVVTALGAGRVFGANDRVRLGFIGLGNRGDQLLDAFKVHQDAEVVAVCDLHPGYREFAANKAGGTPEQLHDYRKLLDRKDVDAVVIATPDHWHALHTVHACRAGKDVYVEKPLSLCVAEGRAMVTAARDGKRVVQCGIQRQSSPVCAEAAELIRSGGIGKVTAVRFFHVQNEWPAGIGRPADGEPPPGFDWDAWTGPAPLRKYNPNRTFYKFRWFYDFSGGQLTNMGVHYLAQVHRSLGVDAPRAVVAMGGKFADFDNREVPDTMEVVWQYPGDVLVTFTQLNANGAEPTGRPCEIEFRGTTGTMLFRGSGYEVVPEVLTGNEFPTLNPLDRAAGRGWRSGGKPKIVARKVDGRTRDADHARNFLDCAKSRQSPNCDVEFGHRCTTAALVGNIAHRTRSFLDWDAAAERFTNNAAANKLLRYEYRKPHEFPG